MTHLTKVVECESAWLFSTPTFFTLHFIPNFSSFLTFFGGEGGGGGGPLILSNSGRRGRKARLF